MRARRAAAAFALLAVLSTSACGISTDLQLTGDICGTSGTDASITPEQNANAKAIADTALRLGLGQRGIEVGIVVSFTEATLNNVGYGDYSSNGQMTTSRGLFQQKDAWGPLEARMDPAKAAELFYTLDKGPGLTGLMHIPGWQQMPIPQAAQAVQGSQFKDGSNFAKNLEIGTRIAAAITGGPLTCTQPGSGTVLANGVNVSIPDNEFVKAEELRGKTIQAPNAEVAKGLAAGFSKLGMPYVWGGGGSGADANNGCSRGGGSYNSCGSEIGFDCSGLTAYVMKQGTGAMIPGSSGAQRAGGVSVPFSQGLAGDIVGFDGHVAMFLGHIDGSPYILEASQVGTPIRIVKLTRTDYDGNLHRYWSAAGIQ